MKIHELERKASEIDRKFTDLTAGLLKVVEDIISRGTLAFMTTTTFDMEESVDEPMTGVSIMSTPVSTSTFASSNLITEGTF